jgi:ketosteroid isomerase-like protein
MEDDPRIGVMKRVFKGWEERDFDTLVELTDPEIFAELVVPPGDATESYRGQEEIRALLRDGDETYEHFKAEPRAFAVGSTGRVFAEGSVSYNTPGARGMTSVAFWVCEVRDGKIVSWQSFSDRRSALAAAGLEPPA